MQSESERRSPPATPDEHRQRPDRATSAWDDGPAKIAVVIPCFKVRRHVLDVVSSIGPEVSMIFVVDDRCPESSGALVEQSCTDPRIKVLYHDVNKGVGGAVVTGYRAALAAGASVVVKLDGDGQMDASMIPVLVADLLIGDADYAKGNRLYSRADTRQMPGVRLFGNALLSFVTKLSSGYWSIVDPTNGFTAIHRTALELLDLDSLAERYFFESDMLIKLGDLRAVVVDVRMAAQYGDEVSNLKIGRVLFDFLFRHLRATARRIVYSHFVRDFSLASLNLLIGLPSLVFGIVFGGYHWWLSVATNHPAPVGTVMVAVLPIVLGVQMILFFFSYDISNEPRRPVQETKRLRRQQISALRRAEGQ